MMALVANSADARDGIDPLGVSGNPVKDVGGEREESLVVAAREGALEAVRTLLDAENGEALVCGVEG